MRPIRVHDEGISTENGRPAVNWCDIGRAKIDKKTRREPLLAHKVIDIAARVLVPPVDHQHLVMKPDGYRKVRSE